MLDSATREASLLVDAFHNSPAWSVQAWRASVETLYNSPKINMLPPHGKPSDPHRWFHDVVRQIRHYASRVARPEQYAAALALALLIKACKDPNADGAEHERRAMAQVFGELLLVNNFNKP